MTKIKTKNGRHQIYGMRVLQKMRKKPEIEGRGSVGCLYTNYIYIFMAISSVLVDVRAVFSANMRHLIHILY